MGRIALSLALVAALGCEEAATGPTTADFNAERENLKARASQTAERAATQAARAPSAPAAAPPASGDLGSIDREFVYDETGKRDPFRNFLLDKSSDLMARAVRGPLEQFDLAQLSLEAVVWQTGNARALIADPSGETYIVAEGARIGKNEGFVVDIEDSLVRVKETYVDYLGRETTKDIELRMRRNEGG
jgi:Tfp pilus assembly protein PilP